MEKTPYDEGLQKIITLFNLKRKSEVRKYCKDLVIRSEDFAMFIKVSEIGFGAPYKYLRRFYRWAPKDAELTKQDLDALSTNGVGSLSQGGRDAMRKVWHIFQERKMFAAHLFYLPSRRFWHLFYFDQRDMRLHPRNHWKSGPHLHYSRETYTQDSLDQVWMKIKASPPILPRAEHIRFDADWNRPDVEPLVLTGDPPRSKNAPTFSLKRVDR